MIDIMLSLVTGIIVGAVFELMQLPIPAPPVLAGIVGIFGIYLGARLIQIFF